MKKVKTSTHRIRAGQEATIETRDGVTVSGEVESNNTFGRILEFQGGVSVPWSAVATATVKPDPRWKEPGIYVYYSYGVDEDGHLTNFPNFVMKTVGAKPGWWRIGNAGGLIEPLAEGDVPYGSMLPLTIHPDYVTEKENA